MTSSPCHVASDVAREAEIGTAPTASAWVCLEQSGPWGAKAFTQSHLDPEIGKEFEESAGAVGVRPQLIRRPGPHADHHPTRRHIMIASTTPGATWLLRGEVDRPERVLDLDFSALATGEKPHWPELMSTAGPVLLVCTNGRRDVCCARLGRDIALRTQDSFPGRVWEASHLSGHRFAATTALLPSGHVHGRVLDGAVVLEAADRGELLSVGWRGRSTWSRGAQVAESVIREREGIRELDAVRVAPHGPDWLVSAHGDSWVVGVSEYTDGTAPPSCGKEPEPVRRFTVSVQ